MRIKITDERIVLKKYELADVPLLFEAARESRGELARWMPWCHENYSIKESEDFIAKSIENWQAQIAFDYAILRAETNEFVGGASLNLFNWERKSANLGYWVCAHSRNLGIARAATKILAAAAFQDTNLNRIEIAVATENYASQKAAEQSGATREGVLRQLLSIGGETHDAVMFSFIRRDFQTSG